ncbi:hypothetical protein HNQ77_000935 [Silvibacterium bohemicum]|uniref:Uncharacterized protein n=1 Tax=Silvibacterium bohemicum TaxID=1577686 RepID=A0A841JVH2_9BACT|nr:hypothetical protein [Silvibacterium bohemicum]MBB6142991.1 hypothetical protein [Silvibacterium bohemicum]
MRRFPLIFLAGVVFLTACDNVKKPTDRNFRKAINRYFEIHGKTCASIGREFPVDVSRATQKDQYGIEAQMTALEQVGLVHSFDIVVAAPGILGSSAQRLVKRYEVTDEGKKYFQEIPGIFGKTGSFCYGEKTVDSIVKWTEPMAMGSYSQTEVTYTYKIVDLAPWAERPDIQRLFGDIMTTVSGVSKTSQLAGLRLTNQGWEVPAK